MSSPKPSDTNSADIVLEAVKKRDKKTQKIYNDTITALDAALDRETLVDNVIAILSVDDNGRKKSTKDKMKALWTTTRTLVSAGAFATKHPLHAHKLRKMPNIIGDIAFQRQLLSNEKLWELLKTKHDKILPALSNSMKGVKDGLFSEGYILNRIDGLGQILAIHAPIIKEITQLAMAPAAQFNVDSIIKAVTKLVETHEFQAYSTANAAHIKSTIGKSFKESVKSAYLSGAVDEILRSKQYANIKELFTADENIKNEVLAVISSKDALTNKDIEQRLRKLSCWKGLKTSDGKPIHTNLAFQSIIKDLMAVYEQTLTKYQANKIGIDGAGRVLSSVLPPPIANKSSIFHR